MTTYRNIHGRSIQALSTDPTESVAEGQIWYNTNSDTFKSVVSLTAWSSGAPLITSRTGIGGAGTQTAALAAGGDSFPTATEEYDGSGWSSGNLMGTARAAMGACGTQTSALAFGGYISPPQTYKVETELYNGTSWSEQSDLSTARYNQGNGLGTSTAALYFAGYNGSNLNNTEEYDGSSWTNGGVYPTIARDLGGAGTQTAGLGMGGYMPPAPGSKTPGLSCTYDGSSWTAGPTMNTGRSHLGCGGTQTAGIGAGGYRTPTTAVTNVTETFDGTSFTETADLGTARRTYASRDGTTSAFVVFGGSGAPSGTLTEEFTSSANVITAAAWSSGGNLNTARSALFGAGTQTAGLAFGGNGATAFLTVTEEYDGSSWTEVNDLSSGQSDGASFGTQTAALGAGGTPPPSGGVSTTQEYDGTNWTSGGALNTGRRGVRGAGILTSGVAAGGSTSPSVESSATEEYNGSSWTSVTSMPSTRKNLVMFGIQTAALGAGGYGPSIPGPSLNTSVEYDGTNWTAGGNMNTGRRYLGGCGIQTDGLIFAGQVPGKTQATEAYNGTSFSTRPNMANTAVSGNNAGTAAPSTSALSFGGGTTVNVATTEEFTGETSVVTASTLTTS